MSRDRVQPPPEITRDPSFNTKPALQLPVLSRNASFQREGKLQLPMPEIYGDTAFVKTRRMPHPLVWSPLSFLRAEIRLMTLHPSLEFDDEIVVTLKVVSLLEPDLKFEAISWAWGDQSQLVSIQVAGFPWHISTNLETCFRYFRDPYSPRVFWTDAICIDQKNIEERNSQVLLMQRIFSQADAVRAWTGPPDSISEIAMATLQKIQEQNLLEITINGQLLGDREIECVNKFLLRSWWRRVWVQQEIGLSRYLSIHCGHDRVGNHIADNLVKLLEVVQQDRHAVRLRFSQVIWESFERTIGQMGATRAALTLNSSSKTRPARHLDRFARLLSYCRSLDCSDDRDRIYGLIGLAPASLQRDIHPNYLDPLWKVYRDFALSYMNESRNLSLLNNVQFRPEEDAGMMPSWVPDWSTSFERPFLSSRVPYSAATSTTFNIELIDGTMLKVVGKSAGCVRRTRGKHKFTSDRWLAWRRLFGLEDVEYDRRAYVGGGNLEEAFWQTVCADALRGVPESRGVARHSRDDDERARICKIGRQAAGISPQEDLMRPEITQFLFTTNSLADHKDREGCSLFMTDRGYFGIANMKIHANTKDEAFVLAGGQRCYILRPAKSSGPRHFRLVSQAYVHGLMDGEAVTAKDSSRVEQESDHVEKQGTEAESHDLLNMDWEEVYLI